MAGKKKRLILLDAHAIIHRAYHALPDFSNSKGEPTGALYGIAAMLMKLISDFNPDYIVAAYDLPKKTFRHEVYEDYKAGRGEAEETLVTQLNSSRELFGAFSIPIYDKEGFEADDILGTIVEQTKDNKELEVIIASGDMDTLQLVSGTQVKVFTLKRGLNDTVLYDEKAVKERFGFGPKLLPDYKGLRGDPSDNIIGIAGIGEKTATTLITEFGSIESIYKKLHKNTQEFLDKGIKQRIVGLLEEGEEEALFSKTLATIRRDAPITFTLPKKIFMDSVDGDEIQNLFERLEFRTLLNRARTLFTLPEVQNTEEVSEEEVKDVALALWLIDSTRTTIEQEDIQIYGGAKSFKEGKEKILADIKKNNLTYVYEEIEKPIAPIILEMQKRGIALDVEKMKKLSKEGHKELESIQGEIWNHAGREFNINSPKQLGEVLFDELKIGEGTGTRLKKTEGGKRSTRESELRKLEEFHPIIKDIFAYRELSKLLSTYIDTLPELIGDDGRIHAEFNQAGTTTGRFSSQHPNLQNIPAGDGLPKSIRESFIAVKDHTFIAFDYSQIELRVAALLSEDPFLIQTFIDKKDIHAAVASRVFGVNEEDVTHDMRRKAKVINFGILYGMGVTALQQNLGTTRKEAQEFYNGYFESFPSIAGYMEETQNFAKEHGYSQTLFGRRRYFKELRSPLPHIRAAAERQAGNAPIQGTAADCIKIAIKNAHKALEEKGLLADTHLILQVHDELVYEVKNEKVEEVKETVCSVMENVIPEEFLKEKKAVPLEVHVGVGQNWGELK